jgi:heat shock protein HslJ
MKKFQFIFSATLMILVLATSCKTAQIAENSQQIASENTQNKHIQLKSISTEAFNGEWIITQALDKEVVGDDPVHIIFDTKSHRVYGNNGCNTFNGTLVMGDNCSMEFTNCMSTTMACRPEVTDNNVMQAVNDTRHYNAIEVNNNAIVIELLDSNYQRVVLISRQMREVLNGNWEVVELDGKKVRLEQKPTMIIDIESRKLSGNSGCNIMNGEIEYDNTTLNNGIRFTGVASTRRMCAPAAMEVEDKMLGLLNNINSFRILDNNKVALYASPSEHNLIVIKRK